MSALLTVDSVTRRFGGLVAVRDLSFTTNDGEFLAIIGPNGAGKTTLFNLLSGFYRPDSGSITFAGTEIVGMRPHKIAELGIGRTFQIPQPFGELTVLENVTVAGLVRWRLAEARERAHAALRICGLESRAQDFPRALTASNRKRLEVARAVATGPRLLLLDEVIAGLNRTEMHEIIETIQTLRTEGIGTVCGVEHIIAAVIRLADRIIVLDHGQLIASGRPDDVLNAPEVIEIYLGTKR